MQRAAERVALACKALSAAANDLRVEYAKHKLTAVENAAEEVEGETERVCELAEQLADLAATLGSARLATTSERSDYVRADVGLAE